jgi:methylmalonyl-CoA/ethylmalonyl-CoA epimerase
MIKRIHHIDYVVRDLEKAVAAYEKIFQIQMGKKLRFDERGVELAWFHLEGIKIILVSPIRLDSPVQKFLDDHGEGFFHIAYEVDDLDAVTEHFEGNAVQMVSDQKRPGVEGWDIIDLDLKETFGVFTQLIEKREKDSSLDKES